MVTQNQMKGKVIEEKGAKKRVDLEEVVNIFAENEIENSSLQSPNNANG